MNKEERDLHLENLRKNIANLSGGIFRSNTVIDQAEALDLLMKENEQLKEEIEDLMYELKENS